MMFVNLTPHKLNIYTPDEIGCTVIEPSGRVARVTVTREVAGEAAGITLFKTTFGDVVDLPEPQEDTIFIVSALVRGRVDNREDVFSPGELVRDDDGRPVGCRGITR